MGGKKKLVYRLADKNHVATYIFKKTSEEVLKTHTGKIRTVRMQRVNGNPKHGTIIFWLAPKYDYLPVKVIGIENGKISAEVNLKSYRLL